MLTTRLEDPLEEKFLNYLEPYPEDSLFFLRIWRNERGRTSIVLAMEDDEIHGAMSIHDGRHVRLHGSEEAVECLLQALSSTSVEMRIPLELSHLVEGRFPINDSVILTQMLLTKGDERPMMVREVIHLERKDCMEIASLLQAADKGCWHAVTGHDIEELFDEWEFHGVMMGGKVVAVGSAYFSDGGGNIGLIATHPDYRNMGLGRSIVSSLVMRALEDSAMVTIHVLPENGPAVHLYKSVGFVPNRDHLFLRTG
jgi:ribosomal protein S18 acetylase RimI-like enzyme